MRKSTRQNDVTKALATVFAGAAAVGAGLLIGVAAVALVALAPLALLAIGVYAAAYIAWTWAKPELAAAAEWYAEAFPARPMLACEGVGDYLARVQDAIDSGVIDAPAKSPQRDRQILAVTFGWDVLPYRLDPPTVNMSDALGIAAFPDETFAVEPLPILAVLPPVEDPAPVVLPLVRPTVKPLPMASAAQFTDPATERPVENMDELYPDEPSWDDPKWDEPIGFSVAEWDVQEIDAPAPYRLAYHVAPAPETPAPASPVASAADKAEVDAADRRHLADASLAKKPASRRKPTDMARPAADEVLQRAMALIAEGKSVRAAAKILNIPEASLRRKIKAHKATV